MKQFFILVIALFTYSHCLYSQVDIQIRVKQTHSKQAKLSCYQKSDIIPVDSSSQTATGLFNFHLPKGYVQGLYKLALGKNISFDFIVASEPQVLLETVIYAAEDSLKSIVSKENELFIRYQKVRKKYKQQLWYLNSLTEYYPDSSSFHQVLSSELFNIETNRYWALKNLINKNPNLYTSKLILLELRPLPVKDLSGKELNRSTINSWWTETNLNDARLVNASSLEQKLWEFIERFFDNGLNKEQQDSSFIAAAKLVMNLNADTTIKSYFRSILFKNYLQTDYDATTRFLLSTSFEGLKPMALAPEEQNAYSIQCKNGIGSKAFDFRITSSDGKSVKLSKVNTPYKLIVFWSMWCPHCTEMLPELLKIYNKFKDRGFEVVAICIDEEVDGWRNAVVERKLCWINAIEPDNGKNKIISEYSIDGTPVLLLIDKELSIVSHPSTVKQLEVKLNQIFK